MAIRKRKVLAEGWGPVRLEESSTEYLGTTKPSNNTAELEGAAEAILWLRDEEGSAGPAVLLEDPTVKT